MYYWDGSHEQLIYNGGRFNPAFYTKRDKKQKMIDLRDPNLNWFKTTYVRP
jgi:hypothetical protein